MAEVGNNKTTNQIKQQGKIRENLQFIEAIS